MNELNSVVLVVDDSPETLAMLNDALESAGMTTLVALEGKQAINIAKKMSPDIILLDALMPSLDGFETCKLMKRDSELQHIPVIFMTGLTDSQSIVKGFESGGIDYVTKPINPLELIARIKVHLMQARATLSAQTALDTAGHTICAVNRDGDLLWATPLVQKKLEEHRQLNWHESNLRQQFLHILQSASTAGRRFEIELDGKNTLWQYDGTNDLSEEIFQLISHEQPDELQLLSEQFGLTRRESEVLLWVAKGKTNREAAQILDLSPRTINKHLEQVFRKVGVENRTTAAAMAVTALQSKRNF